MVGDVKTMDTDGNAGTKNKLQQYTNGGKEAVAKMYMSNGMPPCYKKRLKQTVG